MAWGLVTTDLAQSQTTAQSSPLKMPQAGSPLTSSPGVKELGGLIQDHALTIEDAVEISLATSRQFATALSNLEEARGRTALARTQLNPTLGVNANLTQYDKEVVAQFGPTSLVLTNQYNPIYSASVALPIDITGAIRSSVTQAQFREVAARIDINRVRNETVFAVRSAFYAALRNQGQLVVALDNLTNAKVRLRTAEAILKVGNGTKFDVLTAQRDVADAQQSVLQAKGQVTLSLAQLKSTMGIDISAPIRIVDSGAVEVPEDKAPSISEPEVPEGVPPKTLEAADRFHFVQDEVALGGEYAAAVQEALTSRPEVLESEAGVSAARQGIRYAQRSALPSVHLSANYVLQPHNAGFTPEHQSAVELGVFVPIYDGGIASANSRIANAEVATAEVQRRTAYDAVTLDVQQAYVNLVQSKQRIQVAQVGLAQAAEAFRMATLRGNAGVTSTPQGSPQLELINAQSTLTQAETNWVTALYDYNIARSQLQRAMGRYSYGDGLGYAKKPTPKQVGGQ